MNVVRMSRACWVAGTLWSASTWAAPEPGKPPPAAGTSASGPAPAPAPPRSPAPPSTSAPAPPPATASPATAPQPATSDRETANAASEAREVAADAAFRRGNELADSGQLKAALAEFERAYDLLPAYAVLNNIGSVCYRLQRWACARRAYEQYLKLGGHELSPERAERVSSLIAELTSKTATLRLVLNVTGADIHVDGEPVESNEVSGVILEPGDHVVRVSKPGFAPLEQVLRAADGESMHVVLPLAPLQIGALPPESPLSARSQPRVERVAVDDGRTPLWVPWTITGWLAAGWITTAGLAIQARHDRNIIEARPATSSERIDEARRLHQTLAIVSDVLLASALVSGGVSAYLTWWAPPASPTAHGPSPAPPLADGLTLGIFGEF